MATGMVARFDCRRGYGFVIPDDGGEDVFVHQNNIEMEGFRYLQAGEKVSYELEVGEKGLKAVQVKLTEPRQPRDDRRGGGYDDRGDRGGYRNDRNDRGGYRDRNDRNDRGGYRDRNGGGRPQRGQSNVQVDKLRRKLERLINLLVEKDVLAPGEIDGLEEAPEDAAYPAEAPEEISVDTTEE